MLFLLARFADFLSRVCGVLAVKLGGAKTSEPRTSRKCSVLTLLDSAIQQLESVASRQRPDSTAVVCAVRKIEKHQLFAQKAKAVN